MSPTMAVKVQPSNNDTFERDKQGKRVERWVGREGRGWFADGLPADVDGVVGI